MQPSTQALCPCGSGKAYETSRFSRLDGRWCYVDGEMHASR